MARRTMKNKSSNGKEETTDEDRLSSLPDAILINILSQLPTKPAVATSVLSPRWRGLWTQIFSLEFDINHFKQKDSSSFFTVINQVLNQITSLCIPKFILHLSKHCFSNTSGPVTYLESCLHQLCVRNVEQIHIKSTKGSAQHCWTLNLPPRIFRTPSLKVLELDSIICYELPTYYDDDERIHLPNLNKLSICLTQNCIRMFSNLIRSCPSLEDLSFSIVKKDDYLYVEYAGLEISSQSLKQLDMDTHLWSTRSKILINAPNLVKFKYYDPGHLEVQFVTNPISLVEARILHGPLQCITSNRNLMAKCFQGISSVISLVLNTVHHVHSLVKFHNLTHLTWNIFTLKQCEQVVASLESFPVLEVLIIRLWKWGTVTSWTPSASAPPACVATHLKRIELNLNDTISCKNLLVIVEYLLSNARVMEQLIIYMTMLDRDYDKVKYRKEKLLCEQLYKLPGQCQIVFSGIYFKATVPNGRIVMLSRWNKFRWVRD